MKLSVIMSTFNNQDTIAESMESIVNQSYPSFEFIIVNDGSTDNTQEIIEKYRKRDNRIVLLNQENKGLTKSLNIALNKASGDYLARQDADDISFPQRLEWQVNFLDKNINIGFIGCSCKVIDELGELLDIVYLKNNAQKNARQLKKSNIYCHGSMVFRRQFLNRVSGYREFFKYAQDYDLYLRLIEFTLPGSVNAILYCRRIKLNSISIQKIRQQNAYARLAKRCYRARVSKGDDNFLLNSSFLDNRSNASLDDFILPFMKSMYYIKNNETKKARGILNSYLLPLDSVKFKLYLLWLFSYIPLPVRRIVLNTKKNLRKARLNTELKINGKRYYP